jgi:GDP-4-dehydro-6-deoxy-D-mannose reductase
MRVLLSGAGGFVGRHLARVLEADGHTVAGFDREVGLDDAQALRRVIDTAQPDAIVHLAAIRTAPHEADIYTTNVLGTVRLLEAVIKHAPRARVIVVGSSAMYGDAPAGTQLDEDAAQRPVTPYGASKAAADLIAQQFWAATGVPILRARPFNVIGPDQRGDIFTAVCARQLVEAEAGKRPPVLELGNLDASRDFLDVRDLARGLVALAERGTPGEAYNLCSGRAVAIRDVVAGFVRLARVAVTVNSKPAGPGDVPYQAGNAAKITAHTSWQPRIALDQTLADILDDWRRELQT